MRIRDIVHTFPITVSLPQPVGAVIMLTNAMAPMEHSGAQISFWKQSDGRPHRSNHVAPFETLTWTVV